MELNKEERDYLASKELKPCPFCGAAPVLEKTYVYRVEYIICCPLCGSVLMKSFDLPTLVNKWNSRYYKPDTWDTQLPDKPKVIKFLEELRESCKVRSINADEEWSLVNELLEMMEDKGVKNG